MSVAEKIVISKIDAREYIRLECLKLAVTMIDPRMLMARMVAGDQKPLQSIEACANDLQRYVLTGLMAEQTPRAAQYRMQEVEDETGS